MKNLSKNNTHKEVMSKLTNLDNVEDKSKLKEMVTSEDILYSLKPLMDEYLVGAVSCNGQCVMYHATSGQKFIITVTEKS